MFCCALVLAAGVQCMVCHVERCGLCGLCSTVHRPGRCHCAQALLRNSKFRINTPGVFGAPGVFGTASGTASLRRADDASRSALGVRDVLGVLAEEVVIDGVNDEGGVKSSPSCIWWLRLL